MLIDFHTHAFPESLAERALASLSADIGSPPLTDGTVSGLLAAMDSWGVDRAVICNIASKPRQTENVNSFAIGTALAHPDRLFPLGSVHPLYPDPETELKRIRAAGLKGVKIHPDYMGVTLDDPAFDSLFDLCGELGLFVVTHAGFDVYSPHMVYASPDRILRRLERSPRTTLVAAHYGGNMMWDEAAEKLCGRELFIDVSMGGFCGLEPARAARILGKHDPDRILFGSDCPWASPADTFRYIDALPLSDGRKEKIWHLNAERLLGSGAGTEAGTK